MSQSKSRPIRSTGDLARALGLSRWTVSRALNGHEDIGVETAERVRREAERLGFAPSLIGRSLRSGTTDLIGVSLPDLEDFYLTGKVKRLQECLATSGWRVVMQMGASEADERAAHATFASMRCAGVVAVASRAGSFEVLKRAGIPVVAVDALTKTDAVEIRTDRAHAMRLVLRHLHAVGHRAALSVGFSVTGSRYQSERVNALRAEAVKLGWSANALAFEEADETDDFAVGEVLAKRYLEGRGRRPRAVVALNDRVAFGFLETVHRKGLSVPGDVAVVGYDDSALARYATPSMTSVDPRSAHLIETAVERLLSGMAGKPTPGRTLVRPTLVVRESA